jgi:ribonuclease D
VPIIPWTDVCPIASRSPELPPYPASPWPTWCWSTTPEAAADAACRDLLAEAVLGFDTEAKPTFAKGEVSTGPHLIQLATEHRVWLFQVPRLPGRPWTALRAILESPPS